mmetsp:Transcript_11521/g.15038  ORF Transcript_11521/g.15038 Transcript_11521/m.15038 type:complete len:210 (-) Transcript_11521:84-713(-)
MGVDFMHIECQGVFLCFGLFFSALQQLLVLRGLNTSNHIIIFIFGVPHLIQITFFLFFILVIKHNSHPHLFIQLFSVSVSISVIVPILIFVTSSEISNALPQCHKLVELFIGDFSKEGFCIFVALWVFECLIFQNAEHLICSTPQYILRLVAKVLLHQGQDLLVGDLGLASLGAVQCRTFQVLRLCQHCGPLPRHKDVTAPFLFPPALL